MTALPIDLEAFEAAPLAREPFAYAMVPHFVKADAMRRIELLRLARQRLCRSLAAGGRGCREGQRT